jgi:hypothetical protein
MIATIKPRDLPGKTRRRLAAGLISELGAIDKKIRALQKELTRLVTARGPALLELHGIGPSSAARLLADAGDIHRFADRGKFASWNGTAPLDASSGNQERHRLSRAGNRRINRALHLMAVVQLRNQTKGRAYYDARKAGGMPSMMAMRALKRRLSNVVFARMLADQKRREAGPGGQSGTTTDSSATGLTPDTGPSDKPHPGPATHPSAGSSYVCPLDDSAEPFVVDVVVAPDDVPADHAGLLFMGGVVGAVEREVPQRGELGFDAV